VGCVEHDGERLLHGTEKAGPVQRKPTKARMAKRPVWCWREFMP
jgi:hypothetical protein